MPTYEYECEPCGRIHIERRGFYDPETYPQCCEQNMKRIYFAAPAHFKGTGWGKDGQ